MYHKFIILVHSFLKSEFDKRNDLKSVRAKLISKESNGGDDNNMIYRFKYESKI